MGKLVTKTFTFDGKRYFVRGKDEASAEVKKQLKMKALEDGHREISGNMTVNQWAAEWLDTYKEPNISMRHYKDIRGVIKKYISPSIGAMKVKQIKPLHLQKILNGLTCYSDSYISKIYDILRQIFTEAYRNNMIANNPADAIKKPQGKKKRARRAITPYERAITLKVAEYHRGGLFVLIMLYCGLRPGEVAALKWCDVDMERKLIHVHQANKADDIIGDPKTAAGERYVPVPKDLAQRFLREKRYPLNWVCTDSRGNRLTKSSIRNLWESFKREMNIAAGCRVFRNQLQPPYPIAEDLCLYCYRHTYCTDLQAAGVPINVAKELMGHSSIAVTAEIYTHRSDAAVQNAAALIDTYNDHVTGGVAPVPETVENRTSVL